MRWLLIAVCLSGCELCDVPPTIVEHPVHAELRTDLRSSAGEVPDMSFSSSLTVERADTPGTPASLQVECRHRSRALREDATGARLAYRCGDDPWHVVYFASDLFAECHRDAGRGDEPDWSHVPDFAHAAGSLLGCTSDPGDLLFIVNRDLGAAGVERALSDGIDANLELGEMGSDAWASSFDTLASDAQNRIARAASAILRRTRPRPAALWHALIATGGEGVDVRALAARATELLDHFDEPAAIPLAGLLRVLIRRDPGIAASLACRAFQTAIDHQNSSHLREHALIALAATHAHCQALATHAVDVACGGGAFCGDARLCSTAEIEGPLHEELGRAPIAAVRQYPGLNPERAQFAAVWAAGLFTQDLLRQAERSRYHLESGTMACWYVARSEQGTPCQCVGINVCQVPANESHPHAEGCRCDIDDGAHTVTCVRDGCSRTECNGDDDCCEGLVCPQGICQTPSPTAAH